MSTETLLLEAIRSGDFPCFSECLSANPNILGWRDSDGSTLLHRTARFGRLDMAEKLLINGLDPNICNSSNRTALHDSVEFCSPGLGELLINHGATVDIHYAAAVGDLDTMRTLLDEDPSLLYDRSTGLTPLEWAAYGDSGTAIELLNEYGLDVNFRDPTNAATALMAAAECNNCRAARAILELGGDPNMATHQGFTSLHYAATMRFAQDTTPVTAIMLAYNADVNIRAEKALTPLGLLQKTRDTLPDKKRNFDGLQALLQIHGAVV